MASVPLQRMPIYMLDFKLLVGFTVAFTCVRGGGGG